MTFLHILVFVAILLGAFFVFILLKGKGKRKAVPAPGENSVDLFFRHFDDL